MKSILRAEYLALLALSILLFSLLPYAWWWFPVLFLVPDVSMIGYLISPRAGAVTYNIIHTFTTGILVYMAGFFLGLSILELAGVILLAHSALDRTAGYGLKYPDSFKHTHLGKL